MKEVDKIAKIFHAGNIVLACELAKGCGIDLMDLFEFIWEKYKTLSKVMTIVHKYSSINFDIKHTMFNGKEWRVSIKSKLIYSHWFNSKEECFKYIIEQLKL
jgi:hypothetical protein